MYNLTCISNYNSIYSQLTVCTLSCTLAHKVSIEPRSPIHTGRETTHTHTRVRGRLLPAIHCNINSNIMKLHSEIEFKLLLNKINGKIFSQAIL